MFRVFLGGPLYDYLLIVDISGFEAEKLSEKSEHLLLVDHPISVSIELFENFFILFLKLKVHRLSFLKHSII